MLMYFAMSNPSWAVDAIDVNSLTKEICDGTPNGFLKPDAMLDVDFPAYKKILDDRCKLLSPQLTGSNYGSRFRTFIESATGIVSALGFLIVAGFGVLIMYHTKMNEYRKLAKESKDAAQESIVRAADPIYASQGTYEHEAVNMVLVGEGGSGKTTLIRSFACAGTDRPIVKSGGFATYAMVKEVGVSKAGELRRTVTRIYVDDYEGQRFGDIATNVQLERRRKYVKSTTLVIVVDLFYADKTAPFSMDKFDATRIREQIKFYDNDGIRQILSKMLRDGDGIVLFINRLDVLKKIDAAVINKAKRAYRPLIDIFSSLKGISFHVIVGSAKKGWGVIGDADGNSDDASLYEKVTANGASISEATLLAALKENAIYGPSYQQKAE